MPTATPMLEWVTEHWLNSQIFGGHSRSIPHPPIPDSLRPDTLDNLETPLNSQPDPADQCILYSLPGLLLTSGGTEALPGAFPGLVQSYPNLHLDLMPLQAVVTTLIADPIAATDHQMRARMIFDRLQPVFKAMGDSVPETDWQSLILRPQNPSGNDSSLLLADHPPIQHTPVTAALSALLTVSESSDLTIRLAQITAQDHGAEPEISGAIAAFLTGLCTQQASSPKTADEKRLQLLALRLFEAWAGLGTSSQPPPSVLPRLF